MPLLACLLSYMNNALEQAKEWVVRMGECIQMEGMGLVEPPVFAVMGKGGAIHHDAMEILQLLPHEIVTAKDLLDLVPLKVCCRIRTRIRTHTVMPSGNHSDRSMSFPWIPVIFLDIPVAPHALIKLTSKTNLLIIDPSLQVVSHPMRIASLIASTGMDDSHRS